MRVKVSFVELHNPLFMVGVNLGNKISASTRHARMEFDIERKLLFIEFKGKVAVLPDSNVCSMDLVNPEEAGFKPEAPVAQPKAAAPGPQIDTVATKLAEQTRATLAAKKGLPTAQVENPTTPTHGTTGLTGKRKYMSHEELAAKVAAEAKEQ